MKIYGISIYVLIPVVVVLVAAAVYLVIKAFNEGREVTFWPPKIGPRTKSDNQETSITDAHQKAASVDQSSLSPPSISLPTNPVALLRIVSGGEGQLGRTFFLTEADRSITVGRSETCDISFPGSRFFSSVHFRIDLIPADSQETSRRAFEIRITDCGSTNGTYVNGQRITTKDLRNNDEIQSGETSISFHRIDT